MSRVCKYDAMLSRNIKTEPVTFPSRVSTTSLFLNYEISLL